MGHELTVSCVTSGRLDDESGSYDIRDGTLTVEDADTAHDLVERHPSLSWADEPPESEDGDEGNPGEDSSTDEDRLVDRDPDQLTEAQRLIDDADYRTLQQAASQFDDVAGNQSETDLRVALHTEVDGDDVVEAFEALDDSDEE